MFVSVLHWAISVPASLGKDALSSMSGVVKGVLVRCQGFLAVWWRGHARTCVLG